MKHSAWRIRWMSMSGRVPVALPVGAGGWEFRRMGSGMACSSGWNESVPINHRKSINHGLLFGMRQKGMETAGGWMRGDANRDRMTKWGPKYTNREVRCNEKKEKQSYSLRHIIIPSEDNLKNYFKKSSCASTSPQGDGERSTCDFLTSSRYELRSVNLR